MIFQELSIALNAANVPLRLHAMNSPSDGVLNFECGADWVKIHQSAPVGLTPKLGQHCATLDGDADRLMYFYISETGFAIFHIFFSF